MSLFRQLFPSRDRPSTSSDSANSNARLRSEIVVLKNELRRRDAICSDRTRRKASFQARSTSRREQEDRALNREALKIDLEFFKLFPPLSITVAVALFASSQTLGLNIQNAVIGTIFLLITLAVALFGAFFVSAFYEDGKRPNSLMFATKLITVALFLATLMTFLRTSIGEALGLDLMSIVRVVIAGGS